MISFIFSALLGVLSTLGLVFVTLVAWVIWRSDKEKSELPRWYVKLSNWANEKWDDNMDRYEKRQLERDVK